MSISVPQLMPISMVLIRGLIQIPTLFMLSATVGCFVQTRLVLMYLLFLPLIKNLML